MKVHSCRNYHVYKLFIVFSFNMKKFIFNFERKLLLKTLSIKLSIKHFSAAFPLKVKMIVIYNEMVDIPFISKFRTVCLNCNWR